MTGILLIENQALPMHRLRMESRRLGVSFLYASAATAAEFFRLLARGPWAVVSTLDGLADLGIETIANCARDAGVLLYLLGGDTGQERARLAELGSLVAGSYRRVRLPWLPMQLERSWRESLAAKQRQTYLIAATAQLQQAAEQMCEVQKLAILGRLTGSVVHEINNPLESITNLVYLLSMDQQLPEHLRPYVAMAEQELSRVTQISKQTLSFHRETQTPVRVTLSELLDEVIVLFSRRLREKRVEVVRRYESEEPVLLFPGEMRQVYANLLVNALEATEPGGRIVLRIRKARRTSVRSALEGVRVVVADSGSGIPPEVKVKLGQPFYTTKGQLGTGLGLWVSQAIVKRYNGNIQVRSSTADDRHGTTFSVFLPLNLGPHRVESAASAQETNAGMEGVAPLEGLRLRASSH